MGKITNQQIHDNLDAMRDNHPLAFDQAHPFIGRVLADPGYAAQMVARLDLAPERFQANHHFAWRVIDGCREVPAACVPAVPPCDPTPPHAVPEPASAGLLFAGLVLAWIGRGRRGNA